MSHCGKWDGECDGQCEKGEVCPCPHYKECQNIAIKDKPACYAPIREDLKPLALEKWYEYQETMMHSIDSIKDTFIDGFIEGVLHAREEELT